MGSNARRSVLLYDEDCTFCTKSALLIHRLNLDSDVASMQSVDLVALGIDVDRTRREVVFRQYDGTVFYGHDAIGRLLRTGSPPWSWLGTIIATWPVSELSRAVYQFVARHRHHMPGGSPACKVDKKYRN
jgi:predicted DCC family thiol-disulfide oxidoreductase YuxK